MNETALIEQINIFQVKSFKQNLPEQLNQSLVV